MSKLNLFSGWKYQSLAGKVMLVSSVTLILGLLGIVLSLPVALFSVTLAVHVLFGGIIVSVLSLIAWYSAPAVQAKIRLRKNNKKSNK